MTGVGMSAVVAGLMMPRPPFLAGSTRSSLSVSPGAGLPVRAGMMVFIIIGR